MVSSADSGHPEADGPPAWSPPAAAAPRRREAPLAPFALPALTLTIGLAVTLALALISQSQYASNENRLLRLRVHDAGTVLTGALPSLQTTLASAAELAQATGGNVRRFRGDARQLVSGARPEFRSVSLWRADRPASGPLATVGADPRLSATAAGPLFDRAAAQHTLGVLGLLSPTAPALGYAFVIGHYAAYAESSLPASRRSPLRTNSAFSGLDYAVYLGPHPDPRHLLVASVAHLPLPGDTMAQTIPFGDSAVTLAMSTRSSLAGPLPRDLPWLIALVGVVLSVAASALMMRLNQRRRSAVALAIENRRLAEEQRGIAHTLQHALLPEALPRSPRLEASGRFAPGERGIEVGGDWYDVIELGEGRALLVVGDVSGRGLRAAATMAELRYAIRAYAAEGDDPPVILTKVSRLIDVADAGQLATILCARVDLDGRSISVASAGHLPPLLIGGDGAQYLHPEIGLPVGVEAGVTYRASEVPLPAAGTLVAFTDGLVEMRGEAIDEGLARLQAAAYSPNGTDEGLAGLLGRLVTEVPTGPAEDDIAIVGVRWRA